MSVETVLTSEKGSILAPAGCGKTHLITDSLRVVPEKPLLVLTHTTAGVAALKQRLNRFRIPKSHYRISTIDGWILNIASMFPASCPLTGSIENPRVFYPELRSVVGNYLVQNHLEDVLKASYSRLLIDEYQDCNIQQHAIMCSLATHLPTIVFGDPMQSIFGFGGNVIPSWSGVVEAQFPQVGQLNTPWRWQNAETPVLGRWILDVREILHGRGRIDLRSCPGHVEWHQLSGNARNDLVAQTNVQYAIRNRIPNDETLLVIGDSARAAARHNFAQTSRGVDVVEPVDLADVVRAARRFDQSNGQELVEAVLNVVSSMITGVNKAQLLTRLQSILNGRNRNPATDVELAAQAVFLQGSRQSIYDVLIQIKNQTGTRVYRRSAYSALRDCVFQAISDSSKSMQEAAEIIREKRRHQGDRRVPSRAIGSTLLLKGLEADHVLILDAGSMNAKHLYVALSRGAKSLTVFSGSNTVG